MGKKALIFSINDMFIWDWDPFTIIRPGTEAQCSSEDELSLERDAEKHLQKKRAK